MADAAQEVEIFVVKRSFSGSYGLPGKQEWGYFYSSADAEKYLTDLMGQGYDKRELSVQWKKRGARPDKVPAPAMVYCS